MGGVTPEAAFNESIRQMVNQPPSRKINIKSSKRIKMQKTIEPRPRKRKNIKK